MADRPNLARTAAQADPRLELVLRIVALTGLTLAVLLPAGHGSTELLGWTPLWLAGLPLVAWWSLHRFRLPAWPVPQRTPAVVVPLRPHRSAQARRRRPMQAQMPRRAWPSRAA
jgi:hypothetical protein